MRLEWTTDHKTGALVCKVAHMSIAITRHSDPDRFSWEVEWPNGGAVGSAAPTLELAKIAALEEACKSLASGIARAMEWLRS